MPAARRSRRLSQSLTNAQLVTLVTAAVARRARARVTTTCVEASHPSAVWHVYPATSPASKSRPQQQTIPVVFPHTRRVPWTPLMRPASLASLVAHAAHLCSRDCPFRVPLLRAPSSRLISLPSPSPFSLSVVASCHRRLYSNKWVHLHKLLAQSFSLLIPP